MSLIQLHSFLIIDLDEIVLNVRVRQTKLSGNKCFCAIYCFIPKRENGKL